MTVTVGSFRASFIAFGDQAQFPPQEIQYWIDLSYRLHNADRWGDLLDDGVMLYVAHNVTIEFQARSASAAGGNPGTVTGPVTSASADGVSYTRSLSGALDPDSGDWNLTVYGIRWKRLARMFGAGPVQVGAPCAGDGQPGAWPGPFPAFW